MVDSDSDDELEQLQYKVIILGDGAVGKTSIVNRFTENNFQTSYKQTVGVDFFIKRIQLPGNIQVALQLWDIGGQQLGAPMLKKYIYGSHAVLLAYDITNYSSFKNLDQWYHFVREVFKSKIPFIGVIANKNDLNHLRNVKPDTHDNFCVMNDMQSFQMSAKTGDSVNTTFKRLAAELSGVTLSKKDIDMEAKVLSAPIVDHPRTDAQNEKEKEEASNKKGKCVIQ